MVRLALLLCAAAYFAPSLLAQADTAEISGTVTDEAGAVLPNVTISIELQNSGQKRELTTESNGTYNAPSLPSGAYSIKAELANFKTQIRQGIELRAGRQER